MNKHLQRWQNYAEYHASLDNYLQSLRQYQAALGRGAATEGRSGAAALGGGAAAEGRSGPNHY